VPRQLVSLTNLSTPITAYLPVSISTARSSRRLGALDSSAELSRSVRCPLDGRRHNVQVMCNYASGLNASVTAVCETSQARVSYECPVLPRCGYWDGVGRAWSHTGCSTVALLQSDRSARTRTRVVCQCRRFGTFTAAADSAAGTTTVLSAVPGPPVPEGQSYWLVVVLVLVYASLIVMLIGLRLRRATASLAYLR
jgi:hypothetical protein